MTGTSSLVVHKTRASMYRPPIPDEMMNQVNSNSLQDTKLMQSLQMSIQLNSEINDEPESTDIEDSTNASRVRFLAQVKGFRSYNKIVCVIPSLEALCCRITTLRTRRYSLFPLMLKQVTEALKSLADSERQFFFEADKTMQIEQKARELDHLKANIEQCIKKSIGYVRGELYKCNRESQLQNYSNSQDVVTEKNRRNSVGFIAATQERVNIGVGEQIWTRQVEYQVLVTLLRKDMESIQADCDERNEIPSNETIDFQVEKCRIMCEEIKCTKGFHLWLDASNCFGRIQECRFQLEDLELKLMRSLIQHQSATNVLLDITQEARRTAANLQSRTKSLQTKIEDMKTRDVEEEERILIDFVEAAKEEHLKEQNMVQLDCSANERARNDSFRALISHPAQSDYASTATPVWAMSWMPSTKVLGKTAVETAN